ncbi:hypothetical protein AB0J82_11610 [Asanoa sp. NPDC049518]|uniref:hypothetical protein n=1 Tax=unclassified Asanoa TaxID=2685164 RepID=UPI003435BDC5
MAIAFELVVNFGSEGDAARAACDLARSAAAIPVGERTIRLHEPLLASTAGSDGGSYLELSVLPVGVGWGVVLDRGHEPVRLSAAELTTLGRALYDLLATFSGYQAAKVGWDPEWQIDLAELRQDWADELATGDPTLSGLVLAEAVLADLRGRRFVPFSPGFRWIPYLGELSSTLTAG